MGVTTTVAKDTEEGKVVNAASKESAKDAAGTVSLTTNPDGAEVYVDDQFYGNSPATLRLKPGKHTIRVKASGYKDWSREISTDVGAEARLTAVLERSN